MTAFSEHGIVLPAGATGDVHVSCPRCTPERKKQNTRDLSVSVEKGTWLCHHCGWADGLKGEGQAPRAKAKTFAPPRKIDTGTLSIKALEWLESRGIDEQVIERNGIVMASVWVPQLGVEANAICFPYYRGETLVNRKWRAQPKNFFMEKGAERILFKLNDVADMVIITEGEIDALSCEVAGFHNAVSVPDGAPAENAENYHNKFSFLDADWERLQHVKKWILAVDNDGPGKKLERYLAQRLGAERCYRVTWPEGCKDANDVLVKHGKEVLAECLKQPEAYPVEGIWDVASLMEDGSKILETGLEPGLSTGWPTLDEHFTVGPAQLVVITGIPTAGKSSFADNLCLNLIRKHQAPGAVFSPENANSQDYAPHAGHLVRLIGKWKNKPTRQDYNGHLEGFEYWDSAADLMPYLHFIYLNDGISLDGILERAKVLLFRRGIKWLVIDPWNEIEHARPKEMTETQYVGACLSKLNRFKRSTGITIFLVAHPSKVESKANGEYPVVTPYKISDSAHFYNKADVNISLWRRMVPDESGGQNRVQIHVQKMKFVQYGKVGVAELIWHPGTEVFQDPGPRLAQGAA